MVLKVDRVEKAVVEWTVAFTRQATSEKVAKGTSVKFK